jgi:V/A-type H+-transporting ATPase subunit B
MDRMIQLYAQFKESQEKKAMGFRMSSWDRKLLKYGELFESQMMDLSVKISLEDALDNGWKILAECFQPGETGFRADLIKEFWPKNK